MHVKYEEEYTEYAVCVFLSRIVCMHKYRRPTSECTLVVDLNVNIFLSYLRGTYFPEEHDNGQYEKLSTVS